MWHFHYFYQQVSQDLGGILTSIWKQDFSSIVMLLAVDLVIEDQTDWYVLVQEGLAFYKNPDMTRNRSKWHFLHL